VFDTPVSLHGVCVSDMVSVKSSVYRYEICMMSVIVL